MPHIYAIQTFEEEIITCEKCAWSCKGKNAELEPQLLTDEIEIYCPDCGKYLGIASNLDIDSKGKQD
ncbi:MAG: hypothetical protein C4329_12815 [Chitinophagaceae bacterium]